LTSTSFNFLNLVNILKYKLKTCKVSRNMYEINKKILNDLNFEGKQQFLRKLERINMKVLVIKSLR